MTRDERVALSVRAYADADLDKDHEEAMDAALDAALADVGGLDGLTALRADRDRLRDALRGYMDGSGPARPPSKREWDAMCDALGDSEAGT